MIELILLAAGIGIAAIGGTAKLILDSTNDESTSPKLTGSADFPAAQIQGPRLAQLKRKGMLNPQEMARYIEFLEGKLGVQDTNPIFRVPPSSPAPPEQPVTLGQPSFPHVPHADSPQVPHADSPQVPHADSPAVPHADSPQVPQGSIAEEWDAIDEIFALLESQPGISKSQIAFQVFGLTRDDKSGSPNSQWQKAMGQINHCIALAEQVKAAESQQKLQVLMGGKTA